MCYYISFMLSSYVIVVGTLLAFFSFTNDPYTLRAHAFAKTKKQVNKTPVSFPQRRRRPANRLPLTKMRLCSTLRRVCYKNANFAKRVPKAMAIFNIRREKKPHNNEMRTIDALTRWIERIERNGLPKHTTAINASECNKPDIFWHSHRKRKGIAL